MSESNKSRADAKRRTALNNLIAVTKRDLDDARAHGDPLQIALVEAALNDALEQLSLLSQVTDD